MSNKIIHISGPSGSGKTTLGKKLKEQFGKKIIVKDIDDLRNEYITEYYNNKPFVTFDKVELQKYIDNFIKKHSLKPLIFVGLNYMQGHQNYYYDMRSIHNYFIDLDDDTMLKQICKRCFLDLANSEEVMECLINDNEKYIKTISNAIAFECNQKRMIKLNNKWRKDYKKQSYIFLSSEDIYKNVSKLLKSELL